MRAAVAEMLGRDDNGQHGVLGTIGQIKATFGGYKNAPTYDVSRTSYALARAIFYANEYKDRKTGKVYGNDYLLGAPFGKPIVNIAAGFAVGSPVQITQSHEIAEMDDTIDGEENEDDDLATESGATRASGPTGATGPAQTGPSGAEEESGASGAPFLQSQTGDEETEDEEVDLANEILVTHPTISNVNRMLQDRRDAIFKAVRNSYRDGDFFIAVEDDGEFTLLPPEDVDIIVNPNDPDQIDGYDIWSSFPDPSKPNTNETITYVDEIRRTYRRRMLVDKQNQRKEVAGTKVDYRNAGDGGLEERQLPIVHFANEQEARSLYGVSEFQNLYYLMANYHAILAAAIKGNIYNSTAVPVIQGVKNMKQFLQQNFQQDKDGNYTLKWDNQKMLVVGEGGSVQILQANGTATDASTLLNILFWLISQSSETPEFAFGTAVQSSKASVSEQTPMLIKKAIRKQGELETPLRKLIELYISCMAKLEPEEFDDSIEFNIDMPDILDEDLNVNIQIVNAMLEKGIITEQTAMTMLNLGKYVKDFDAEREKAQAQKKARSPIPTDVFGQPITDKQTEADNASKAGDTLSKQELVNQLKQSNSTKKVAEMLERNLDALSLEQIQEMVPDNLRGSEGKDPKPVQEIKVKSGNPYRQNGGRFGNGPSKAGDSEQTGTAAATEETLSKMEKLEKKLEKARTASEASPTIEEMRALTKNYIESNGGDYEKFKSLEEAWVGNDYKTFEDAIDSKEIQLMKQLSDGYFARNGITEIELYRGVYNEQAASIKATMKLDSDKATSWTGYQQSALDYADGAAFSAPDTITASAVITKTISTKDIIYSTHVSTHYMGNRDDEYIVSIPKTITLNKKEVEILK